MKPNMMAFLEKRMVDKQLGKALVVELKRCQTLRMEMNHFVLNLQYYCMFEVLEASWTDFEQDMAKATGLDQLITAHDKCVLVGGGNC